MLTSAPCARASSGRRAERGRGRSRSPAWPYSPCDGPCPGGTGPSGARCPAAGGTPSTARAAGSAARRSACASTAPPHTAHPPRPTSAACHPSQHSPPPPPSTPALERAPARSAPVAAKQLKEQTPHKRKEMHAKEAGSRPSGNRRSPDTGGGAGGGGGGPAAGGTL